MVCEYVIASLFYDKFILKQILAIVAVEIGRAHVWTPVTLLDLVCRLLLEKYCKDNGYEIVAMLSEPASTEGVSFPMKYAFIGLNMEEDVNTCLLYTSRCV